MTSDAVLELAQTLAAVDRDGALRETAAAAFPQTRGTFLRLLGGAGAAAVGLAAPARARAAGGWTRGDTAILRFDLVLEYLQAALYTETERLGALNATTLGWARVVGAHERAHAQAIKGLLGWRRGCVAGLRFPRRDGAGEAVHPDRCRLRRAHRGAAQVAGRGGSIRVRSLRRSRRCTRSRRGTRPGSGASSASSRRRPRSTSRLRRSAWRA